MRQVNQLYCTHCTRGTSATERATGKRADEVHGYGARASSFDQPTTRDVYRNIERFLSYQLPNDTPTAEKLTRTASDTPKRMLFIPDVDGNQVAGLTSYQQQDCAGRPGSYFAHLLIQNASESAWDVLDFLTLWGSRQWQVSNPSGTADWDIPATTIEVIADGVSRDRSTPPWPAIGDRTLHQFLFAETLDLSDTNDPKLLPARWLSKPVADRQQVFTDLLARYLDAIDRNCPCLLVAESGVAALLFYGIARSIPLKLRREVSLCTYEKNAQRLVTNLAATCFDDPDRAVELPNDLYERRCVVNTYSNQLSLLSTTRSNYITYILALLKQATSTPGILDEQLQTAPTNLDAWAENALRRDRDVLKVLNGESVGEWVDTQQLRDQFETRLKSSAENSQITQNIAKQPQNVLRLAALFWKPRQQPDPVIDQVLVSLVHGLDEIWFTRFAHQQEIAAEQRGQLVLDRINQGTLPDDCISAGFWTSVVGKQVIETCETESLCGQLWQQTAKQGEQPKQEFLKQVLKTKNHEVVFELCKRERNNTFLRLLVQQMTSRKDVPELIARDIEKQMARVWGRLPESNGIHSDWLMLEKAHSMGFHTATSEAHRVWRQINQLLATKSTGPVSEANIQSRKTGLMVAGLLGKVPDYTHENFDEEEARRKCFDILLQQFGRRDVKLSDQEIYLAIRNKGRAVIRPVNPNSTVVRSANTAKNHKKSMAFEDDEWLSPSMKILLAAVLAGVIVSLALLFVWNRYSSAENQVVRSEPEKSNDKSQSPPAIPPTPSPASQAPSLETNNAPLPNNDQTQPPANTVPELPKVAVIPPLESNPPIENTEPTEIKPEPTNPSTVATATPEHVEPEGQPPAPPAETKGNYIKLVPTDLGQKWDKTQAIPITTNLNFDGNGQPIAEILLDSVGEVKKVKFYVHSSEDKKREIDVVADGDSQAKPPTAYVILYLRKDGQRGNPVANFGLRNNLPGQYVLYWKFITPNDDREIMNLIRSFGLVLQFNNDPVRCFSLK